MIMATDDTSNPTRASLAERGFARFRLGLCAVIGAGRGRTACSGYPVRLTPGTAATSATSVLSETTIAA